MTDYKPLIPLLTLALYFVLKGAYSRFSNWHTNRRLKKQLRS
jgi:hypothetical protein